jgi:hypothetical protein
MCATSATPAPLCNRARFALAFAPPLPAPALMSPRSATSPATYPCAPCRRCSTPRRHCRASPRIALPLLPPPVQPPLSFPRLATPEPSGCHAPEGTPAPPAVVSSARDHPLSLSPSPSLLLARRCYKTRPNPLSPAALPLLPPHDTEPPPFLLAGILLNRATPPKFPRPTAFPPSPLASRPDPIQPPAFLCRNCFHLEPPLTGAARARPHRRQLPLLDLEPIQVLKSNPHSSLVLVRASLARVHWSFAGNADDPTRPPHLPVAGRIPPPPVEHTPSQTTL